MDFFLVNYSVRSRPVRVSFRKCVLYINMCVCVCVCVWEMMRLFVAIVAEPGTRRRGGGLPCQG